jgi:hypothetical protein
MPRDRSFVCDGPAEYRPPQVQHAVAKKWISSIFNPIRSGFCFGSTLLGLFIDQEAP